MRDQFVLGDAELERESLLMTDRYVDELFALPADEAVTVRHEVSRLVLDPERFERRRRTEPMERVGMGAVYHATHEGDPARPSAAPAAQRRRTRGRPLTRYYDRTTTA